MPTPKPEANRTHASHDVTTNRSEGTVREKWALSLGVIRFHA